MIVENWMKRDVITVRPEDNLLKAERLMTAYQIRHLPVLAEGTRLCGILSDRDIRDHSPPPRRGRRESPRQQHLQSVTVEEVMTREVVTIGADAPMERAMRLMKTRRIDALPVMSGGTLVGILTSTNLLAYFNDVLGLEAGWVKIEIELQPGPAGLARLAEIEEALGHPFSGLIGHMDRERGLVRLSLFLHRSRLESTQEALTAAGMTVVRTLPLSE